MLCASLMLSVNVHWVWWKFSVLQPEPRLVPFAASSLANEPPRAVSWLRLSVLPAPLSGVMWRVAARRSFYTVA